MECANARREASIFLFGLGSAFCEELVQNRTTKGNSLWRSRNGWRSKRQPTHKQKNKQLNKETNKRRTHTHTPDDDCMVDGGRGGWLRSAETALQKGFRYLHECQHDKPERVTNGGCQRHTRLGTDGIQDWRVTRQSDIYRRHRIFIVKRPAVCMDMCTNHPKNLFPCQLV